MRGVINLCYKRGARFLVQAVGCAGIAINLSVQNKLENKLSHFTNLQASLESRTRRTKLNLEIGDFCLQDLVWALDQLCELKSLLHSVACLETIKGASASQSLGY